MLAIKTEAIVGTTLDEALADAVSLAVKFGTCIELNFNDTSIIAHPGDTTTELASRWQMMRRAWEARRRV